MSLPILFKRISDLKIRCYGDTINGQKIPCEPTPTDISDAIRNKRLEKRNYQDDLEALKSEWYSQSQKASDFFATWQRLVTGYHAARIAYFVVNGWDHPVSINIHDEVTDGTHRIKAAIFQNKHEVAVVLNNDRAEPGRIGG